MSKRNIRITRADGVPVESQEIEIVERKGLGHPDSICDGVAEAVSRALGQMYLDRVGKPLHYNTDETQLAAGRAAPAYGGGEVLEPIYMLVVGRATTEYDGESLPAETVALRAAREYLDEQFPHLDVGTDVVVDVRLSEGSGDLKTVFGEEGAAPMANDTSYGVGYAPLSETERIVFETERRLNGPYQADNPAVGQDIKVMGKREGDQIDVTVAAAVVDRYVDGLDAYRDVVAGIREYVTDLAREHTDREVTVHVNTADDYETGSVYLTTTGTSAEHGDDGSVGRGNRVNGLITPNRTMSLEATSGKNPVNHIGKIYNLLSTDLANAVVDEVAGVEQLRVRLLSQIGQPIDHPHVADISVTTEDGVDLADIHDEIETLVDDGLANVTDITRRTLDGELSTF